MNNNIAICVPTYNGGERMEQCLAKYVPIISKYGIPLYVSNNKSTDDTLYILEKFKDKYEHIYIHNTSKMLNYADNFVEVLKLAKEQYVWLLGDDDYITEAGIKKLLSLIELNENPDCFFVSNESSEFEHRYNCPNELLKNISGRILTWMSSFVISKRLLDDNFFDSFHNFGDANAFAHTLSIFSALKSKCNVVHIGGDYVVQLPIENCKYSDRLIPIFCDDWYNITVLLGNRYSNEAKQAFLESNDISWQWFYKLRANGNATYKKMQKSIQYIERFPQVKDKIWLIKIIMVIPPIMLKNLLLVYKWLK